MSIGKKISFLLFICTLTTFSIITWWSNKTSFEKWFFWNQSVLEEHVSATLKGQRRSTPYELYDLTITFNGKDTVSVSFPDNHDEKLVYVSEPSLIQKVVKDHQANGFYLLKDNWYLLYYTTNKKHK